MASRTVKPHEITATPEWVFRWRRMGQPLVPKLVAVTLVGAAFVLLVTTVRIRVEVPERTSVRKAAVIYLRDDAQGRAMSLRAREGGPFPSRFVPSQWEGMAAMEAEAMEAVRFMPPAYSPPVADLPAENQLQSLELAAKGVSFFPERTPAPAVAPDPARLKLAPVLYPLSKGIGEILPAELPPFDAVIDAGMTSTSWRFLVRLTSAGMVEECVSLEKVGEPGALALEKWLRKVQFKAEPAKPFRWIVVGLGFTNQPADGTDAR